VNFNVILNILKKAVGTLVNNDLFGYHYCWICSVLLCDRLINSKMC